MRATIISGAAAALFLLGEAGLAQDGSQLLPRPDEPNTRVGSRGASFLKIGVGARAMALGGAFVALSDGVSSLYWNPSGIAQEPSFGAMASYNRLYGDIGIDEVFLGATLPLGVADALGLHVIQLSSGDIERTTENFPEGGDPQFGRTFDWTSQAFGLSYARRITDRLVAGATIKLASEGIEDARATFFGGDVGIQFETGLLGTTVGASLLNVGSSGEMKGPLIRRITVAEDEFFPTQQSLPVELDTDTWDMPTAFSFSVLWQLVGAAEAVFGADPRHTLHAVTDLVDAVDTDIQTRIGFEYGFRGVFFLRAGKGWMNERDTGDFRDFSHGLSGGLGLSVPIGESLLNLDYAYTDRGLLDNIQVFSIEYRR